MTGPICSTLSGHLAKKHPILGVLVRDDGAVFMRPRGGKGCRRWTFGADDGHGYKQFMIDGVKYKAHRLVADTFIDNPDNKPTIDHINGNRSDNRVENLRWATMLEQSENSVSHDFSLKTSRPAYNNYSTVEKLHRRSERRKRRRGWIASHIGQSRKFSNGVNAVHVYFGTGPNRKLKWVPIELAAKLSELPPGKRIYEPWMNPLSGRWSASKKL